MPKYHAKLGNEVTLIVTNMSRPNKDLIEVPCEDFISKDGFRVIRRPKIKRISGNIGTIISYLEVYDLLTEIQPDYVFFHGLGDITIFQVIKYKCSHPDVYVVQDNHLDYNIGFNPEKNFKTKLLRLFFRTQYRLTNKYIDRVYGVTPWRKEYAMDVYSVPSSKAEVLLMGADDEMIDYANRSSIRKAIRHQYNIAEDDFLVITGGKLDREKGIIQLIRACGELKCVKLLVFGNILDDVKNEFYKLIEKYCNVIYIGWITSEEVYNYYFAADLAVFPGQHSVLWEQACAAKIPCMFKRWEGMNHVDVGGNARFMEKTDENSIQECIRKLLFTQEYFKMYDVAMSKKTDVFLYSNIAKKTMEI